MYVCMYVPRKTANLHTCPRKTATTCARSARDYHSREIVHALRGESYSYIHAYIHTYIHTHAFIHNILCRNKLMRTYPHMYLYLHTIINSLHSTKYKNIHTYMYIHVHTYIHTYIHTYVYTFLTQVARAPLCESC